MLKGLLGLHLGRVKGGGAGKVKAGPNMVGPRFPWEGALVLLHRPRSLELLEIWGGGKWKGDCLFSPSVVG